MSEFNKIINDKENRIKFLAIMLLSLFFIIFIKIIFIYTESKQHNPNKKENLNFRENKKKHNILDANGELLATTVQSYNFYISPKKTVFPENTIKKINEIFPTIKLNDEVIKKLHQKHKRLVLIKKEITEEEKSKIIENGIEAAEFEKTYSRIYPYKNIFSHIIGYVNDSLEGVYGVERSFNEVLLHEDVKTSLDSRVQSTIHFKLSKIFKKYRAQSGFAIVINIKTGQVVSSLSLPDFDPKNITDPNGENMKNTAISEVYNLGSVFKIFTVAMGLEYGLTENQKFNTQDPIKVDRSLTLQPKKSQKMLTMSEILAFSSNIGTSRILEAVGLEKQREFLEKIKLFKVLNIELSPYEIAPPIYKSNKWSKSMHYTISYGYGVSTSPLHFANIVKNILGTGTSNNLTLLANSKTNLDQLEQIIKPQTKIKINKMLKDVINIGTAKQISHSNGYEMCGKTSTTYKYDREIKKWSNKKKMISFISVFPCTEPKYLIYLGLNEPLPEDDKSYYLLQGGTVMAPATAEIISEIAPILNIKPDLLNK